MSVDRPNEEQCWSRDGSDFEYTSFCDLIDSCHDELEIGSVVYQGTPVRPDAMQFAPSAADIFEWMNERAYEEHHEYAEGWPIVTKEAEKELDAMLTAWITKYVTCQFYNVEAVKPYTITAEDLQE